MTYKPVRLCGCGCGTEIEIKPHHKYYGIPKYIHGHNTSVDNPMSLPEVAAKSAQSRTGSKRSIDAKIAKSEAMIDFHLRHPEMSRSSHGVLHSLLRKLNIEILHINRGVINEL